MNYKILVIDGDRATLDQTCEGLAKRGFNVLKSSDWTTAAQELAADGAIHAVLTEWRVPLNSM